MNQQFKTSAELRSLEFQSDCTLMNYAINTILPLTEAYEELMVLYTNRGTHIGDMLNRSVAELCDDHPNLMEYVKRVEQERNQLKAQLKALAKGETHCVDCCCAQSWKALGITEYTGKSIPEHITQLRSQVESLTQQLNEVKTQKNLAYDQAIEKLAQVEKELTETNRKLEAERDNNVCLATENEYQRQLVKDKERKLEVAKEALRRLPPILKDIIKTYSDEGLNMFHIEFELDNVLQTLTTIIQKENEK